MPRKVLTAEDVKLIRECVAERKRVVKEFSRAALARKFNAHVHTIDQVIDGKTWRHVS